MNSLIRILPILALLSSSALALALAVATEPVKLPCTMVTAELVPCVDFITSKTDKPPLACCAAVNAINSQVKSQADRSSVCSCLKTVLASIGSYDKNNIPLLPKKCGVSITLPPIDSKTDCSKAYAFYGV